MTRTKDICSDCQRIYEGACRKNLKPRVGFGGKQICKRKISSVEKQESVWTVSNSTPEQDIRAAINHTNGDQNEKE